MKKLNLVCVLALLTSQVNAEPTPPGGTPTFTNSTGGYTYYHIDGTPVGPNERIFVTGIGVALLQDSQGRTIGSVFETPSAAAAANTASNAAVDCTGPVVGPSTRPSCTAEDIKSGAVSSDTIVNIDEDAYNEKVFELNAVLYGATEIGAKSCKPAGEKMPGSLDSWFKAIKAYSLGETKRDKLLNSRLDAIQKKVTALTTGAEVSKELQIEAIQLQIDTVSASIESIGGTSGRIPLREAVIIAALESTKANVEENLKTVKTFQDMINVSFADSTKAAQAACDRKKKVEKCETVGEGEDATTSCHTELVPDPVPGCDVALAQIPAIIADPATKYADVYVNKVPSTSQNNMMNDYEEIMDSMMKAIPKSNDAAYDWSSPMEGALEEMKLARKESGAKCPEGPKDPTKLNTKEHNITANEIMSKAAASFLEKIGVSEDSKETADAFTGAWAEADKVVGQAGFRSEYFSMAKDKANAVLAIDKQKLSNLQITKAKLEKYLTDINKMLAETKTPAPTTPKASSATASNNATAAKSTVNTLALAKTSSQAGNAAAGGSTIQLAASSNKEVQAQAKALDAKASVPIITGPNGSVSTFAQRTLAGADVSGLNLGSQSMALAKKSMDSIAAAQKKLNTVLSSSSGSGEFGKIDNKNGATKDDNSDKFTKMFEAMAKSQSSGGSTSNALAAATDKALDKVKDSPDASEIYKTASAGGSKYYDAVNGYSGSSSSPSRRFYERDLGYASSSAKSSDASKATTSSGRSPASSVSSSSPDTVERSMASVKDAATLSDSIVAKKAKSKDAYVSKDGDSLFERVTKAYIRNYEKVEDAPKK